MFNSKWKIRLQITYTANWYFQNKLAIACLSQTFNLAKIQVSRAWNFLNIIVSSVYVVDQRLPNFTVVEYVYLRFPGKTINNECWLHKCKERISPTLRWTLRLPSTGWPLKTFLWPNHCNEPNSDKSYLLRRVTKGGLNASDIIFKNAQKQRQHESQHYSCRSAVFIFLLEINSTWISSVETTL